MSPWQLFESIPILSSMRVLAVATSFPVLAGPGTPATVRLWVSAVLAMLVVPMPFSSAAPPLSPMESLLALPMELLIGLSIGFAFSLVFHMLAVAGDFAGQEMGLNAASQIDPVTGRPVPLLARLFEVLGLVLFVEIGGFGLLLRTIELSFDAVPVGSYLVPTRFTGTLAEACTSAITAGVTIAVPAGIVLLLLTAFTTITARTLPKLHIFDFAFATRMMAAIFLVSLLLPRLLPAIEDFLLELIERLRYALLGG